MTKWDDLSEFKDNVYKNETSFDYDEWNDKEAVLTFTNVAWDAEYEHVVDWKTDEERDAYFEGLDNKYVLKTSWNFKNLEQFNARSGKHIGSIRVDEPYESMVKFNYVKVEMYSQPVPGEGKRKEIYYYFISPASVKLAGNTVELELELDSWTTYKNSLNITGMKLQRGHYAHARTPASKFLKNPLDNQLGILTHEPTLPSVKPLISNEKLVSFQKNSPRVCVALTADLSKPDNLWLNVSDVSNVSRDKNKPLPGANWWMNKMGGDNVKSNLGSNGSAPIAAVGNSYLNGNTPSIRIYSMAPSSFNSFIDFIRNRFPQVVQTIQGVFLLDSALISEGAEIDFYNYKLKPVIQQNSYKIIDEFKPAKSDFGYKAEYADFAKLYTTQFAILEVSNLQGQIAEVSIEDIAEGLEFYSRSSAAFPFLKLEAFINGIGGKDKKTYAVKPWNNANAQLFKSSWEDFKFDIDIPVYGVFAEAAEISGAEANAYVYKTMNDIFRDFKNIGSVIDTDEANQYDNIEKNFNNTRDTINTTYNNSISDINRTFSNSKEIVDNELSNSLKRINTEYSNRIQEINTINTNEKNSIDKDWNNTADEISRLLNNTLATNAMNYNNSADDYRIKNTVNNASENNAKSRANTNYSNTSKEILRDENIYIAWDTVYKDWLRWMNSTEAHVEDLHMSNNNQLMYRNYLITKHLAYVSIYQQWMTAELEYNLSSLSLIDNTIGAAFNLSPSQYISGIINDSASRTKTHELFEISSEAFTTSHNLLNTGIGHHDFIDKYDNTGLGDYNTTENADFFHPTKGWKGSALGSISHSVHIDGKEFRYDGYSRAGASFQHAERNSQIERYREADKRFKDYWRERNERSYTKDLRLDTLRETSSATQSNENSIASKTARANRDAYDIELNDIASRVKTVNNEIANNSFSTSAQVSNRTKNVEDSIADLKKSSDTDISNRTKNSDTSIANSIFDTGSSINSRTKTVDTTIADRLKATGNAIASRTQSVDKAINKAKAATDRAVNTRSFNTNKLNVSADYLSAISGEPVMYSENAGKAWIDAWGHRGIDIRVKRCSTATEETAGRTFYKYGYYVDDLWIEKPEFSLMKYFTYWQADDMWISSAEVNETNKYIISNIFRKGCTVWRKPEYVRNVKITDNKLQ